MSKRIVYVDPRPLALYSPTFLLAGLLAVLICSIGLAFLLFH